MTNELVIDVSPSEIAIALLQDKQLVELNKEKSNNKFSVGDIYLGRVKKIMSGLNAAFVDVGYERDAFLHYLDLGPQFSSLNDYVQKALKQKGSVIPLAEFRRKPDINKHGKIHQVLSTGQYVLVQIAKEPISSKGPRIGSEISIPGRNIVLVPFSDKVSVSQKIKSNEERNRLKRLLLSIKPDNYGVIVRTVAQNKNAAELDSELRELIDKWENALNQLFKKTPPYLVIGEINRASAILRDMLNNTFSNIYVNDQTVYNEIKSYIETIAPEKQRIVKLYNDKVPIFDRFSVDKQIKSLFGKTVSVHSSAYLIIEHTEALHVIDVNSGNRSKKGTDQETNALDVNLLAANEIARQLRLRDMGGIIVVDFIDMRRHENKRKVYEHMKSVMALDRTKHNILPLSKFGLMQITRQRVRPEMNIKTSEVCPTCKGTGKISPTVLFVEQIENHLKYVIEKHSLKKLTLAVDPYIGAYLTKGFRSVRKQWNKKYKCRINVRDVSSHAFLEYHFYDENEEEIMT